MCFFSSLILLFFLKRLRYTIKNTRSYYGLRPCNFILPRLFQPVNPFFENKRKVFISLEKGLEKFIPNPLTEEKKRTILMVANEVEK